MAAQRVIVDKVPFMIAGGVESISLVQGSLNFNHFAGTRIADPANPMGPAEYEDTWLMKHKAELFMPMIATADVVAKRYKISREALLVAV